MSSSHYQQEYERLRTKMDRTMTNLKNAQSAARSYGNHASPLRQSRSRSPPRKNYQPREAYTEKQITRKKSYENNVSFKTTEKRRVGITDYEPIRQMNDITMATSNDFNGRNSNGGIHELLRKVTQLQNERDMYLEEEAKERQKNIQLEGEFRVLRELVREAQQKPTMHAENAVLRDNYNNERQLRIEAESEASSLRQQLGDDMGGNTRDVQNLQTALAQMQNLNNQHLQTIHQKGEENLAQMQQMEDLSQIIRTKEKEQDHLLHQIEETTETNDNLRIKAQEVKNDAAQHQNGRGADLLRKSTMADQMKNDPRFQKLIGADEKKQ